MSKQCNFDCLYCELAFAKTVSKQTTSINVQDIICQLKESLLKHPNIDVITFTANGEPSLYPYLSELIDEVDKIKGSIKTLILSNGANIYKEEIQTTLSKIDIVKLSLDCVSTKCFKKLDRVDSSVECERIVSGMIEFRKVHKKQLVLETLFVKNLNDNTQEILNIYEALQQIQPNRIDIGTIDRPPAYDVQPIEYSKLLEVANIFQNLPVTIAHKNKIINKQSFDRNEILVILARRPLTLEDIENSFDDNSIDILNDLVESNELTMVDNNSVKFYTINT